MGGCIKGATTFAIILNNRATLCCGCKMWNLKMHKTYSPGCSFRLCFVVWEFQHLSMVWSLPFASKPVLSGLKVPDTRTGQGSSRKRLSSRRRLEVAGKRPWEYTAVCSTHYSQTMEEFRNGSAPHWLHLKNGDFRKNTAF